VALSAGADRAILTATGAVATLTMRDVPSAPLVRARHVHVSSYFLVADSLGPGLATLLEVARAAGAGTSLDTNWDPAQRWAGPRLTEALAHASLLLPNEAEALCLADAPDLDRAVPALAAAGPALVVKLGERGALCTDGTRRYLAEPPPVKVTDTTGAGDCFNAGVIAGLLGGLDLPAAVALGCAVGAASTRAPGGTAGCPDLATARDLARAVTVREVAAPPPRT